MGYDPNSTVGNPERIVLWTTKSLRNIENLLREKGLKASHDTIGNILKEMVQSILRWWQTLGANTYPKARTLYITSDNGGSNGSRTRLWKKTWK